MLVNVDEIPLPIQWHEGMLLAPQHFQQSSWRAEMLVQYSSLLVSPFCWGVRRLAVDQRQLPEGIFNVQHLEAVLKDGSVVSHRSETGDELILDLKSHKEEMSLAPITIHLTLPARSAAGLKGELLRYKAIDSRPTVDENTGEGELRLPMLRPVLHLHAGDPVPPKFVSMPLARMEFKEEAYVLTNYVPPTMAVSSESPLAKLSAFLVKKLREKSKFISQKIIANASVLEPMLLDRLRMQALVAGLPSFNALLATGQAHPLPLYLELCSLAGHLAALGPGLLPREFVPYQHDDLRATFQDVIDFALEMTDEGIPESYLPIPFQKDDNVFKLLEPFRESWTESPLFISMRMSKGVSDKETIDWGMESLIGAESVIPALQGNRIRGATRAFVPKDKDLVPPPGAILFKLNADAEFIKTGEILQVLNFGEKGIKNSPAELVLFVNIANGKSGA